jgi:hypothetical protein
VYKTSSLWNSSKSRRQGESTGSRPNEACNRDELAARINESGKRPHANSIENPWKEKFFNMIRQKTTMIILNIVFEE